MKNEDISQSKLFGALGLAMRARALTIGGDLCEKAVRNGSAKIVIICNDAAINTLKKIQNACKTNNIQLFCLNIDKENLAIKLGKSNTISCVAITNESFADMIYKLLS